MSQDDSDSRTWPSWAVETVEVVEHDPAWAHAGNMERSASQSLLAPWLAGAVEHIGSTAVPGLAAKAVIDLQAPVADFSVAQDVALALEPHAWHYVAPELDKRSYRRFFVKVAHDRRIAHLHLLLATDQRWADQLAFRDALRRDASLARGYAALKIRLVQEHAEDREAYTVAKAAFVRSVLSRGTRTNAATQDGRPDG